MPDYPIEADKLLGVAEALAPSRPGRGRPSYTSHRRAVSTAYYALFHAISARVAEQAFPDLDRAVHDRVRRWINHADVRYVSEQVIRIAQGRTAQAPVHDVLSPPGQPVLTDPATEAIAEAFGELHTRRQDADYDHTAVFTRRETRSLLAVAERAIHEVETVDSPASIAFFGLIGFQAKISNR